MDAQVWRHNGNPARTAFQDQEKTRRSLGGEVEEGGSYGAAKLVRVSNREVNRFNLASQHPGDMREPLTQGLVMVFQ
jgi:hypothetical protein